MEITLESLIHNTLGDLTIWCETNHDHEVYANLANYNDVMTIVLDELERCAEYADRAEASARSCGGRAQAMLNAYLEEIFDYLPDEQKKKTARYFLDNEVFKEAVVNELAANSAE